MIDSSSVFSLLVRVVVTQGNVLAVLTGPQSIVAVWLKDSIPENVLYQGNPRLMFGMRNLLLDKDAENV